MLNTCSATEPLKCYECNSITHSDCDSSNKNTLSKYEVTCDAAAPQQACVVVDMDFSSMTDFGQGGYHIPKPGSSKHPGFKTVRRKYMRGCVGKKGTPTKTISQRSRKRKKQKHHHHIRDVEEESEHHQNIRDVDEQPESEHHEHIRDLEEELEHHQHIRGVDEESEHHQHIRDVEDESESILSDLDENILSNQNRVQRDADIKVAGREKGVLIETKVDQKLKFGCNKLVVNFGSTRVVSCICKSNNCNSGRSLSTDFSYRVMISLIAVGTILTSRLFL